MKKLFLIFSLALVLLFLIFSQVQAKPCGGDAVKGFVPCGQDPSCPCEIEDFFAMLGRIYTFLVLNIATPLAILALTIGGILILISAGNPKLLQTGKDIFRAAVIGLVLVFCSWLIIDLILGALGYNMGTWSQL